MTQSFLKLLGWGTQDTWRFRGIFISRVISRVTILINHIRGLISLLITTPEPPSRSCCYLGHREAPKFSALTPNCHQILLVPTGPKVVPFWGSYLEFYKVIPKRNYFGVISHANNIPLPEFGL